MPETYEHEITFERTSKYFVDADAASKIQVYSTTVRIKLFETLTVPVDFTLEQLSCRSNAKPLIIHVYKSEFIQ